MNLNIKYRYNNFFRTNFCLIVILLLLFVGDTLTKIYIDDNLKISWIIKASISLILVLNLFYSNKNLFLIISILFLIVLVGMVFNFQQDLIAKISLFFEYVSGILFFQFLIVNQKKVLLSKLILIIFSIYVITILTASLLGISYLTTYKFGRFGYMPLFSSQNEFSFIMITIVVYFYKSWIKRKSMLYLLLFTLSVFASLLIGTKVIYLFIFIFFNYLLIKYFKLRKSAAIYVLILLLIFLFKENLILFLNRNFEVLVEVYQEKGILDAISSLRLSYLKDRLICQNSTLEPVNIIFGGLNIGCLTEMSLFDVLLFFGVLGVCFYFYSIKKAIIDNIKLDVFGYFYLISITLLSFVGGYFFENFSAQIYSVSLLYIFYHESISVLVKRK